MAGIGVGAQDRSGTATSGQARARETSLLTVLGAPIRDRNAERREAARAEILDAAWALAAEHGIARITLREIARRIGMRAPSLYTHFDSKKGIYNAMFAQAWGDFLRIVEAAEPPAHLRAAVRYVAHMWFDFATADLARHQLMNQRTIPGFEPTPEAYAPAVAVLARFRALLAEHGVTGEEDVDLCTAVLSGLADAQLANDPGGDRWGRLVDRTADMLSDNLGLATGAEQERP